MTDSELLDAARRIVRKSRESYIPPGPFLGGRVWNNIEADVCMDIINLVKGKEHPLKSLAIRVHEANKKWWENPHQCTKCGNPNSTTCINSGEHYHPRISRNFGELMMLAVSELAEALEGDRKDLMDDKLPHRPMREVEIADCIIRLFDTAEGLGMDLAGAFEEKMAYNAVRADHKHESRLQAGGKKY